MHTKSPGVSIVIAMGVSLFISSLVLGTMISIGRSFDREVDMGRSLQFYYASESGIESALFHKNARGKGLHLPAQTVSDQALQSLALLGGDINTSWNLEGRASELVGLLEDGRPLEISLFRQIDQSIADTPTSTVEDFDDTLDFEVNFYERSLDMPTDLQNAFTQRFGTVDLKDYPFIKIATDEPYMDWSAKRLGSLGYEIFRPEGDDTGAICPSPTPDGIGFRACKSHVADTNLDIHTLGSLDPGTGVHQEPALGTFTSGVAFSDFLALNDPSYTHRSLLFNPLGPFRKDPSNSTAPAKIPGIPFGVTLNNTAITDEVFPTPQFSIHTQVQEGTGFALQNDIVIQEKTSSNDFNYVMFD